VGGGGGACFVDDVAQHFRLGHHEGALAEVDGEAVGGQHGKELVQVLQVLRRHLAADPAVI
jgi:hypothetical protein